MMKKYAGLFITGLFLILSANALAKEHVLVIREAKQAGHTTVAVEAYLDGDVLEVKVIARMRRTKPRIYNVVFTGPRVGRVAPDTRETLYPTTEGEKPFPTKERKGFISFDKRVKKQKSVRNINKRIAQI